jgi:hypothetical protein
MYQGPPTAAGRPIHKSAADEFTSSIDWQGEQQPPFSVGDQPQSLDDTAGT